MSVVSDSVLNVLVFVDVAVDALSSNSPKDVDENDFIDASRLVYDGVREIRRAVLMNRVSLLISIALFSYPFPNSLQRLIDLHFNDLKVLKICKVC